MSEKKQEMDPLAEAQKLGLITAPPTSLEKGWTQLDDAINKCLLSIKQMQKATTYLKKYLDHPFHVESIENIDGLIDEALIPYLAEVDQEFRTIAPS